MSIPSLKNQRVYIAMPYSHEDPTVVETRMDLYSKCDTVLINQGVFTMSPVAKHYTAVKGGLPSDWNFWKGYSEAWLVGSHVMIILMMDGWMKSSGIQGEIKLCQKRGTPIIYVNPNDILADGFDVEELVKFAVTPQAAYTGHR